MPRNRKFEGVVSTDSTPMTRQVDWRGLFDEETLTAAQNLIKAHSYADFFWDQDYARCTFQTTKTRSGWAHVRISGIPSSYQDDWALSNLHCDKHPTRMVYDRSVGSHSTYHYNYRPEEIPCAHKAALLLLVEGAHGPWTFTETPEEVARRIRQALERRELDRQMELRLREWSGLIAAAEILPAPGKGDITPYFNIRPAAKSLQTHPFCLTRAREFLSADEAVKETSGEISGEGTDSRPLFGIDRIQIGLTYSKSGEQYIMAQGLFHDVNEDTQAHLSMMADGRLHLGCDCESKEDITGISERNVLCEHELVLLRRLYEHVMTNNPGDATDKTAERFFEAFGAAEESGLLSAEEEPPEKVKNVTVTPRIVMDNGTPTLSFKIGQTGGRQYILKGLRNMLDAREAAVKFMLSKQAAIDFATCDFTDESLPWVTLIQRRVSETDDVNDRLSARSRWGYYHRSASIAVQNKEALSGSILDRFYDLAEGMSCEYQNKSASGSSSIRIGHAPLTVTLTADRISDPDGNFLGAQITGSMPVLLYGANDIYKLDERALSRITREEQQALLPFTKAADENGSIRFRVGKERLAEFYYRVVPVLLNNPVVQFEDHCAEEAEQVLPPEGSYTFRLDVADGMITCQAFARYGEEGRDRLIPAYGEEKKAYYDSRHEDRIQTVIKRFFEGFDASRRIYGSVESEDKLFKVQMEAVPVLERYGSVLGTEAFRRGAIRPAPTITVGVSIESGLMELSVLSKDISPEELLGVLESYRARKKYYRLKSGAFVGLSGAGSLSDIDRMLAEMDLSAEEVIGKKASLPAYRALYLDKLLEEHDTLAADRDRTYRALIKNFRTIRDADYELPSATAEVLRPYQTYGYKWLRTISAAGFGGILADEMGLGKTLQVISLIAGLKEENDLNAPALVVCPASLVYNWQEEFHRFAPKIRTEAVAGGFPARRKLLNTLSDKAHADVYITSYDLCRKDLDAYREIVFSFAILDEAQYIKNQKAGLTKAVKSLKAAHRLALTGTPIENRLAELWSIFDFLMPGFLYRYEEFARRIETPVTKAHDETMTARLKQLVGPFILRRLKTDVLKDLPPKLEEVRYARFGDEQRRIYDGQVVRMKEMILNGAGSGEDRIRIFAELMRIRQICCDPSLLFEDYHGESAKREACVELIRNAIEGGHRMLVFSQFTSMLSLLEEDLKAADISYYKLTGQTPKEKRIRMMHEFNNGVTPVFLISLKAGGTGLNLTGADVVIHYDPWWNLAAQNQATDRAHRIGQDKTVTVYKLIAKDSIEERILALQEAKRDLADAILSGESSSLYRLTDEELLGLLG